MDILIMQHTLKEVDNLTQTEYVANEEQLDLQTIEMLYDIMSQWNSLIQNIRKMILTDQSKNLPARPSKPFDEIKGTDKVFVDTMTLYLSWMC